MASESTSTRKWSVVVAIMATCVIVGFGIGYLIGKML